MRATSHILDGHWQPHDDRTSLQVSLNGYFVPIPRDVFTLSILRSYKSMYYIKLASDGGILLFGLGYVRDFQGWRVESCAV
jgi:hypothetical protein